MALTAGAIAAAAPAVTGLLGNLFSSGPNSQALADQQAAIQAFLNANVPDPQQQQVELEHYKQTGQFSPTLQQAFQQQGTALNNIKVDPSGQAAELSALGNMTNIANTGGMDAEAKLAQQQGINAANTNMQGQVGAITQDMARRGMGGATGAGLASMLQASQNDANSSALAGQNAAASAQARQLAALQNMSAMGSNLYSQDYGRAAQAAQATDAINAANTRNSQQVAGSNAAAQTAAQANNTMMGQQISNMNTQQDNQQQMYNKQLQQQAFQDQLQKASGLAGQYQNAAGGQRQQAGQTSDMFSGIGQGVAQGAGAYGQYQNNQDWQNTLRAISANTAGAKPTAQNGRTSAANSTPIANYA